MNLAEAFLKDQISQAKQSLITTTMLNAYAKTRALFQSNPSCQIPTSKQEFGNLLKLEVEWAISRLVENEEIGLELSWPYFHHKTGKYLQIRLGHSLLTISKVSNPSQQPRKAVFREQKRVNNTYSQLSLFVGKDNRFGGEEDNRSAEEDNILPHILLLHGNKKGTQELAFLHLAIPDSDNQYGLKYKTPNLLKMPHLIQSDEVPIEDTDMEALITLKKEIDRRLRDERA
ncbi:hypothetical protein [Zymomonas mobilis]|uniref:Uncharacterized protein n=2 Tax=Zymomonas mobilis TaxID=542 RepID=A0A806CG96_ZYMMO|nr:hypothetical protein [Zymomonas mobilis]ADC33828.1 hypothetical protein ZZM4_0052 [Zymomonas mobilis subsp. mobilis ZM4 = ATCC 31821]AHB11049.1 hypothetical protein ZCP4_1785 [Zymomonas mobilis subsp. mobilis str. CP4 = NRRL B-14023]AHJ71415.1 hypothetical protein A254_01830 [Zymomonas mobilis subsp. mobilis NRRL B-12526]AHJ73306.1 hypothetical protein A265_01866 [Zymomonas mobilis subsp. mobilis str. CP4 = NRRL B-14023]